ncbi:ImcF-related family protein, partial [Burkholderia ubonensis]
MDRKFWFDVLLIGLVALLAGLLIWIGGQWGVFASPDVQAFAWRVLASASGIALIVAIWRLVTGFRVAERRLSQWLNDNRGGTGGGADQRARVDVLDGLPSALRARHGLRWRYRQPWLLLTGDDTTIGRLLPELAERGWLLTDDAVLLWGRNGPDGCLDEVWLKQIRRFRRARPLDAIVLTLDDSTLLPDTVRGASPWGLRLARIAHLLCWSAPVYMLDLAGDDPVHHATTPITGCEFSRSADAPAIEAALLELRNRLADTSIGQLARNGDDRYASDLSTRLDTRSGPLARWIANLSDWQRRPLPVAGAFFSPWPAADTEGAQYPLWRYLADAAKRSPGRRTGAHPITVLSVIALAAVGLWSAGMLTSGVTNARELALTNDALRTFKRADDAPARLRALLALQQRIEFYEARTQHPTLFSRFGLNHDRDVLTALWAHYTREARPRLVAPVQQNIEAQLVDLSQMPTTELDDQLSRLARDGHAALKTYLMLAEPTRADAAFLTPQLVRYWIGGAGLSPGEKLDLSQRLLSFYAQHLSAHPDWRLAPRDELVGGARQTLLAVIGVKNSDDTIYQGILDSVGHKYPDQTLASLTAGTDT